MSLSFHLSSLSKQRLKQTGPIRRSPGSHQGFLFHSFFFTNPLAQYLISLLPCPLPVVPGLILCLKEQSLLSPRPVQSIILLFVFSSKPISWVVVLPLSSALYRWPTCVLREVMLFDHSSLATFPLLASSYFWSRSRPQSQSSST